MKCQHNKNGKPCGAEPMEARIGPSRYMVACSEDPMMHVSATSSTIESARKAWDNYNRQCECQAFLFNEYEKQGGKE